MVPEEPRGLEVEATGGMDGLDVEERGAPAGVVTPPRMGVDEHGGLRAPGSRLPPRGHE